MIYHWKTITQDIMTDPELQETLDDDITEICQKGGWEVYQIDMVAWQDGESIIQRVITLRSCETVGEKLQPGDIPIMRSAFWKMRELSAKVMDAMENENPSRRDDINYALQHFYIDVKEILGL